MLVGGSGQDTLYGWGNDILVGGSNNAFSAALITRLNNDPFAPPLAGDGARDTFIAVNKQGLGYTLTVTDYEVGIDRIDLRAFGVTSAAQFVEIQDKGGWFEAKTPVVGSAELVLRINADPNQLTYI
ncbi:MAG: hypothetical protein ACK5CA_01320 [Cyanobacteriota bacterium]